MKVMMMMPSVKRRPTNGSNILKMEELQEMTMSRSADLQLQDLNL
jgi:hypothetical protein